MGSFSGGYTTWFQPEAAVVLRDKGAQQSDRSNTLTGSISGLDKKFSLEQLAGNYIVGRRQEFMAQGRREFRNAGQVATNQQERYQKRRKYREAYDTFTLADSLSVGDPQARSEVKLAMMYAAVASQQYALAIHALGWVLTPNPRTGRLPDPLLLTRIGKDLENFYGPDLGDYRNQMHDLKRIANRVRSVGEAATTSAAPMWSLAAVMLWPQDKSRALGYARQLEQEDVALPWAELPELMRQAEASTWPGKSLSGDWNLAAKRSSNKLTIGLPFEPTEEKDF